MATPLFLVLVVLAVIVLMWYRGGPEMVIKALYCVFLGALIVLFVGWLLAALYPTPRWDTEYPNVEEYEGQPTQPSEAELEVLGPEEAKARLAQYEARFQEYQKREAERAKLRDALNEKTEKRGMIVSLISLLLAVVVTSVGVGLSGRLPVISEGLLLGGLFTLVYSIGWSFVRSPKIAVIPVGVGLIVTIALGYKRFVMKSEVGGPTSDF